jgi:uncharacterized protein DUF6851/vanadium-dependent haloperoxidase-like protein
MQNMRWLRRRRLVFAVAGGTTAALAGSLLTAGAAAQQQAVVFDLDRGNAVIEVIYAKSVSRLENPGSSPILEDRAILWEIPLFDAIAPYHPTAVGIFSNLGRRPRAEHTTRNKNIAVIYSAFTSLNEVYPQYKARWVEMMESAGLDPNNTKEDPTTPSGIGILAAKNAIAARRHDGSNRYGDAGGRKYNRRPYADYTGYRPVNDPYRLRNPSRWQPNTFVKNTVFKSQQFATPHYGLVKPFTFDSPARFKVSPPTKSNHYNRTAYRRQADEVLHASANLTDRQKMTAEVFNDGVLTFGGIAGRAVLLTGNFDTEKTVHYVTALDVGFADVAIATWYFKRKYDSVRPFSAIRYLYGHKKVTAWGGPYRGTVSDITGAEWRAYLDEWPSNHNIQPADHPEYPSDSTARCLAFTQQVRRFTGTDKIDLAFPVAKGSSLVEPGATPAGDLMLRWTSWSGFAKDCGESNLWGGQNFRSSIEAAAQYAPQIGDMAYNFVQRKLNGG